MHPDIFKARRRQQSGHIRARLLRWSREDESGDLRRLVLPDDNLKIRHDNNSSHTPATFPIFDVIIASDCLFFKDFHPDFYWLLKNATAPGGVVLLLQPPRSGTLDLFLAIVRSDGCFRYELTENYLSEVCILITNTFPIYVRGLMQ